MSSILKALKKLEYEKTGHTPDVLKIDADILKNADSSNIFSPRAIALLFLMFFGFGVGVTLYFKKETRPLPVDTRTQPALITAPPLLPPTAAVSRDALPAEKETGITRITRNPAAGAKQNTNGIVPASGVSQSSDEPITPVQQELPVHTIPPLRVDGIAFNANGSDTMAIINGTALSNGSNIEGVSVEEIQKDRVIFQHNGERFEVLLGQSNR